MALLTVAACRSTVPADAKSLAARGAQTGERMAAFYDALAQDTVDAWELTAFRRGFLQLPAAGVDTGKQFERQYRALRSRARLARRLGNVYEAFGTSANYDAGAAINAAVDDLDEQLREVIETPLDRPVVVEGRRLGTVGEGLDRIIGAVAVWKQARDLKSGARLLGSSATGVTLLFRSERELYRDIARDRAEKYRQVAIELIEAKEVVSTPLVNRVLASYELSWPESREPFQDERTIAGIREVIEARSNTFEARSESDTDGVARALAALLAAHEELEK